MLQELSGLSSGFGFDDSDYDCGNSATYVGSHLCNYRNINPAHMAKHNEYHKRALVTRKANGIF